MMKIKKIRNMHLRFNVKKRRMVYIFGKYKI